MNESGEDLCQHPLRPVALIQFPLRLYLAASPPAPLRAATLWGSACHDSPTRLRESGEGDEGLRRQPPLPRQILISQVMGASAGGGARGRLAPAGRGSRPERGASRPERGGGIRDAPVAEKHSGRSNRD